MVESPQIPLVFKREASDKSGNEYIRSRDNVIFLM